MLMNICETALSDPFGHIIWTYLSTVLWVMVGWLSKQEPGSFDKNKLFSTFFAALFIAVLTVGWDVPHDMGYQAFDFLLLRPGLVAFIDKVIMALYHRTGLKKWLEDFLNISG